MIVINFRMLSISRVSHCVLNEFYDFSEVMNALCCLSDNLHWFAVMVVVRNKRKVAKHQQKRVQAKKSRLASSK